jgi:hypothetical protein
MELEYRKKILIDKCGVCGKKLYQHTGNQSKKCISKLELKQKFEDIRNEILNMEITDENTAKFLRNRLKFRILVTEYLGLYMKVRGLTYKNIVKMLDCNVKNNGKKFQVTELCRYVKGHTTPNFNKASKMFWVMNQQADLGV